jgi:hypothetical protein
MKRIILILSISLVSLASCKKYEPDCTCGVVTNDALTTNTDGSTCYSLTVKNDCSGNLKTWCFPASTWYDYAVGDNMCVSGVGTW